LRFVDAAKRAGRFDRVADRRRQLYLNYDGSVGRASGKNIAGNIALINANRLRLLEK
jgi:hypothetical protein